MGLLLRRRARGRLRSPLLLPSLPSLFSRIPFKIGQPKKQIVPKTVSKPIPPFLAPAFDHVADESSQHFDSSHFASARVCVCVRARGREMGASKKPVAGSDQRPAPCARSEGESRAGRGFRLGSAPFSGLGGGRGDGELGGAGTVFLGDG